MTTVVYADILFIINAYVTDLLLLLSDLVCRDKGGRGRRALASLCGGGYAFTLFLPGIPRPVFALFHLVFAALLLFIAHGKVGRVRFLRLYGAFFLCNFLFAGLMGALWHTLHPRNMLYAGSVVYFAISTRTLVLLTIVCYAVLWAADRLLQNRRSAQHIFSLTIVSDGKSESCRAFLDTGNDLTEPFSGLPVILLHRSVASKLFDVQTLFSPEEAAIKQSRLIPCRSLGGNTVLEAFRPEKVLIRCAAGETETDQCYLAVTDAPIKQGEFDALLHPKLLEQPMQPAAQKLPLPLRNKKR